jgi:hypothetical protein
MECTDCELLASCVYCKDKWTVVDQYPYCPKCSYERRLRVLIEFSLPDFQRLSKASGVLSVWNCPLFRRVITSPLHSLSQEMEIFVRSDIACKSSLLKWFRTTVSLPAECGCRRVGTQHGRAVTVEE